jgi:hypothetical protein
VQCKLILAELDASPRRCVVSTFTYLAHVLYPTQARFFSASVAQQTSRNDPVLIKQFPVITKGVIAEGRFPAGENWITC